MAKQEHAKKAFQGVTRLFKGSELKAYVSRNALIVRYIIATEDVGEETEHVHFILEGDAKEFNLYRLRKGLKEELKKLNKEPKDGKYENGMLNITAVQKPDRMVSYVMKERVDYVHGYNSSYIKECKKKSFLKKVSMTKAILSLKEKVVYEHMSVEEYTLQYRQLRIAYRKPDPNWPKEYDRMEEQMKTEEIMRKEISDYKESKYGY